MVEQTEYRLNSRRSIQNRETLMPVISNLKSLPTVKTAKTVMKVPPPLFLPPFSVILTFGITHTKLFSTDLLCEM